MYNTSSFTTAPGTAGGSSASGAGTSSSSGEYSTSCYTTANHLATLANISKQQEQPQQQSGEIAGGAAGGSVSCESSSAGGAIDMTRIDKNQTVIEENVNVSTERNYSKLI